MPQVYVRQSTTWLSVVILILLMLCVGLLVAVLKGMIYHENTLNSAKSQRISAATEVVVNRTQDHEMSQDIISATVAEEESSPETTFTEGRHKIWENFRLPGHVMPIHYDLLLHPSLDTDNFTGSVDITTEVTEPTEHFIVHAYRLVLHEPKVYSNDSFELPINRYFMYEPNEFFVLELENRVPPGTYTISLRFSGKLTGSIVGFYKSRYRSSQNGEMRYLATSKFQPTYARRAFPCFDEPTFKSTFSVSLVHESGFHALSNMPAEETTPYTTSNGSLLVTKFQKSVPMVTYLTCFIVCDFDFMSTSINGNKVFRVFATKGSIDKAEYALEFGSKVLEFFENYFHIQYVLPKQDMVAIPDFVSGAMEHWGIITYRETNMLYDPMRSSPQNKQRVASVVSHEMAHMWFGNLVTMDWWDDLWLNEGFASYIEYKGVHSNHPDWDMLDQFVTDDLQPVMRLDSTLNSHPIVQPVSHPDEITEIFDDISYNKGASVLRMLEYFLGESTFQLGLSHFLNKYKFRNARTADLWAELASASPQTGLNVSVIMESWTKQVGFPYVTVVRDKKNQSRFTVKQNRFLRNSDIQPELKNMDNKKYVWHVPLSYVTERGDTEIIWLNEKAEKTFEVPLQENEWIKFNDRQTGYYIVNYDKAEWNRLIHLLKTNHQALNASDRSNLLFDAFLLAEAGHIGYDVFLSMSTYLKNETHLIPWETSYASFIHLMQLLESTDVYDLIKNHVKIITEPLYTTLGWDESESHLDNLLRNTIIGLACQSGNRDCLNVTTSLFLNWTRGQEIPATIRRLVYHYGIAEVGHETHWNYMWNRYVKEDSPQERSALLYGLSQIRKPYLIVRFLDYAMDESKVRRQDFFTVLRYLASNPVARRFVWNFLRLRWEDLVARFTLNDRYFGLAVKRVCSRFSSENELLEIENFFKKYPTAGAGTRRREQALESVRNNIKWLKSYKDSVGKWLLEESVPCWMHYRLPSYIVPLHYNLFLRLAMDNDTFDGTVKINVEVKKPTIYLLVHASNLAITKTEVVRTDDQSIIDIDEEFYYSENQYWVLKFTEKLSVGDYRVFLEFHGVMNKEPKGIFKFVHTNTSDNDTRSYLATHFERVYARSVFPGFDEPTFKSTFSIYIVHDSEHTVLANSIVMKSTQIGNGFTMTTFDRTLPVATCMLGFVVGSFQSKETFTDSGILIRIHTLPQNGEKASFALKTANDVLRFYERYFDYPYPLNKLDMVSLPGFYGETAIGLVAFEDSELLLEENGSSVIDRTRVARQIASKLANLWIGNLVTVSWWNDVWLDDGFATFVSYKAVQELFPTYSSDHELISGSLQDSLLDENLALPQRISKTIYNARDIETLKTIPPSRGSSLLRMLENVMGAKFKKGISEYVSKYAHRSVLVDNLWSQFTLDSSKDLDIARWIHAWTDQLSFPVINVTRNSREGDEITIQQFQYSLEPKNNVSLLSSLYNFSWQIPLTYITSKSSELKLFMLNSTKATLNLPCINWIKFNVNFSGHYVVNYDIEDWKHFSTMLQKNHTVFSVSDRANLLFDSFVLAKAGKLSYEIPLELTLYLKNEEDWLPWNTAIKFYKEIVSKLDNATVKAALKQHFYVLSKPLYKKLSWNDKGQYSERILRNLIIKETCCINYECIKDASHLLKKWLEQGSIQPSQKDLIYYYGMQTVKDEPTWMLMWNKYLNESSSTEKSFILSSLANVRNQTLLAMLLFYAEDENNVPNKSYFSLLENINRHPVGQELIEDLIRRNWTELIDRFKLENERLEAFVKSVFSSLKTEDELTKINNFYRVYYSRSGKKVRDFVLENVNDNIKWLQKFSPVLGNWLMKNVYMPWKAVRLPRHIVPYNYDIRIQPNVSTGYFEGSVKIIVNVTLPTDYIFLHSDELSIEETKVSNVETFEVIPTSEVFPFELNQFWVILFNKNISTGAYSLFIKFFGFVQPTTNSIDATGLIKTRYTNNITREERHLLYTQFEATFARKMFPCFDEPSLKSKFKMTVIHDPEYVAISNMPEENEIIKPDGLIETVFLESPPMSSYLVCIVVSDFDYKETEITHGKKLRYFAPPDRINSTLRTVNVTPTMMNNFEEFFDIPYALPKLDLISIPLYPLGGMENWGLVVLGDSLLVDESSPEELVMRSDKIVAHELAHQWFGNLVTMQWWNDIWLNEGFSSFAMYQSLKHFYPHADELVARKKADVMMNDCELHSRPIVYHASDRTQISDLFDSISYEKGAAVISMLEYFMKDGFRQGISNYLKKYAYSNAETKDLWDELSNTSDTGINITEVMDTWTMQMGFPYVEIKRNENSFTAKQRRYVHDTRDSPAKAAHQSPYGYVWKIPLSYKDLDTGKEYSVWLNEEEATFTHENAKNACLKFNPNFVGYYIVKYDDMGWYTLSQKLQMDHEAFSVTDRYSLMFDAILLVEEELLMYDIVLELTKYLKKEMTWNPWQIATQKLLTFISKRLISGSEAQQLWENYIAYLTDDVYDIVPKNQTDLSDFHVTITTLACINNNKKCIHDQSKQLERWLLGEIPADNLLFKYVLPHIGNETIWNELWLRFLQQNSTSPEISILAFGLTQFRDEELLEKSITSIIWQEDLPQYIVDRTMSHIMKNPFGVKVLWRYVKENWDVFSSRINVNGPGNFEGMLLHLSTKFKTERELEELKEMLNLHSNAVSTDHQRSIFKRIEYNIKWLKTNEETITTWLRWNLSDKELTRLFSLKHKVDFMRI